MQPDIDHQVVVGIDPGKKGGAVALWRDGRLHDFLRTPLAGKGSGTRELDPRAAHRWLDALPPILAIAVERTEGGPVMKRHDVAVMACSEGLWLGLAIAHECPLLRPRPQEWKREAWRLCGIASSGQYGTKDAAVAIAINRFPDLARVLAVQAAEGIADAALIAEWARFKMAPWPSASSTSRTGESSS